MAASGTWWPSLSAVARESGSCLRATARTAPATRAQRQPTAPLGKSDSHDGMGRRRVGRWLQRGAWWERPQSILNGCWCGLVWVGERPRPAPKTKGGHGLLPPPKVVYHPVLKQMRTLFDPVPLLAGTRIPRLGHVHVGDDQIMAGHRYPVVTVCIDAWERTHDSGVVELRTGRPRAAGAGADPPCRIATRAAPAALCFQFACSGYSLCNGRVGSVLA